MSKTAPTASEKASPKNLPAGLTTWRRITNRTLPGISEDFSLLVAFLLVTFSWFFRGFFVALFCLEKQCSGLFRYFFVAFSWLFRGPRFGQILHVLALDQSSENCGPRITRISTARSTKMSVIAVAEDRLKITTACQVLSPTCDWPRPNLGIARFESPDSQLRIADSRERKISLKFFGPKFFHGRPRGMSVRKCLFFQDLEGLTEVFGRMSAGMSGPKLPLWAEFSFLIIQWHCAAKLNNANTKRRFFWTQST